ncbi:MAG: hypothetical protein KC561_11565 [Myxococcales bacterium]|nr:hypothetical protein [Myxococcales bacterium]
MRVEVARLRGYDRHMRSTIRGIARSAVLGPVIVTDSGEPIYLEGIDEWPASVEGRRVEATGLRRVKKLAPDPVVDDQGAVSHGMQGESETLSEVSWRLVES